ncbi:MAG: hypothetical protein KJ638_09625, partial [Chloroflexi bacterium]|nr:hypothetical protein [Chloroflexota bacterium]
DPLRSLGVAAFFVCFVTLRVKENNFVHRFDSHELGFSEILWGTVHRHLHPPATNRRNRYAVQVQVLHGFTQRAR